MKIIDVHSHWGTKRGYPLQKAHELAQQRAKWNSETRYHTEAEMADYFRRNEVRAILDLGFAKYQPFDEMQALHDYAFETEAAHQDVILGHWIHIDPERAGRDGVGELRRCIDKRIGFLGYAISASLDRRPRYGRAARDEPGTCLLGGLHGRLLPGRHRGRFCCGLRAITTTMNASTMIRVSSR
jgi:hypothetical protein